MLRIKSGARDSPGPLNWLLLHLRYLPDGSQALTVLMFLQENAFQITFVMPRAHLSALAAEAPLCPSNVCLSWKWRGETEYSVQ